MPAYKGEYEWAIVPFVDAMRVKLAMNKHKDKGDGWASVDLKQIFEGLKKEVAELDEALLRRNTTEILLECADIANFAMIVANVATREATRGVGSEWKMPESMVVLVAPGDDKFTNKVNFAGEPDAIPLPETRKISCLCGYVGVPHYTRELMAGIEHQRKECPSCHRSHDHV